MIFHIKKAISTIGLVVKLLGEYDQYRITMALDRIRQTKAGVYVTNLFVFSILAYIKFSSLVKRAWRALFVKSDQDKFDQLWDSALPLHRARSKPRILIVAEMLNKQCRLYRVEQKIQQLERLGWHCEVFSWQQLVEAKKRVFFADIVLFYRVVGTPKVVELIDYVRSCNKLTIFDVDDLVFDKTLLEEKYADESELLADDIKNGNLYAADLYRTTAEHCDYAITTTPTLQKLLAEIVIQKQCYLLPNALAEEAYDVAALPMTDKDPNKVVILYGSGSATHDDDFQEVANALVRLMDQHTHLHIAVVGKLGLPSVFTRYESRIIRLPIVDFSSYLMFVRQSDINIAPLQRDVFTDAKSEIKWLEASLFEVPSVMTTTSTYRDVVEDSVTGFFAESEDQWFSVLNALVESPELRQRIGASAKRVAIEQYGRDVMPAKFSEVITQMQGHAVSTGILEKENDSQVKSVLVVASYFSPMHMAHDPLLSVRRSVETILSEYGDQYELMIVTAGKESQQKNTVTEYCLNGIKVMAIGLGDSVERLNDYQNIRIEEMFGDIVDYFRPDLIHFHHLDKLSASVVEVVDKQSIPYVVSVYDDWWFKQASKLDPFLMIDNPEKANDLVERSRYLATQLMNAQRVFALSDYQLDCLRDDGIDATLLLEGVTASVEKMPSNVLKVACLGEAFEQSNVLHKALSLNSVSNLEIHHLDYSELPQTISNETENGVAIVGRGAWQNVAEVTEFLAQMSVIVITSRQPNYSDLIARQALACDALVIVPEVGVYKTLATTDDNVLLYAPDDAEQLNNLLQQLPTLLSNVKTKTPVWTLSDYARELNGHYQDILRSAPIKNI